MTWRLKIALTAVLSFVGISLNAQDFRALEVGTSLHNVIAVGDDPLEKILPRTSLAIVARYNLPYRLAIRASFAPAYKYTEKESDNPVWDVYKSTRAALGIEYHFSDFNIYDGRKQFTSYTMIGGSYQFGDFPGRENWDFFSKARLGLMGAVGAKLRPFPMMVISAEIGAGYLFSDDYDRLPNSIIESSKYNDRSGNDWYLFPNLTITYTFGPKF